MELQDLLSRHALTVLNSWHDPTPATYHGPTGDTQIDFIATRHRTAGGRAKWARAITGFPIGAHRLSGHYPVYAQLPVLPFYLSQPHQSTASSYDKLALQQAFREQSPRAEVLRQRVADRLHEIPTEDLLQMQKQVNHMLLQETASVFPARKARKAADTRISADPEFQISARRTWQLYRLAKKACVCTLQGIWRQWHRVAQFAKASSQLRLQSKQIKRAQMLALVDTAETAAAKGDQRVLYEVVRRLTPKTQLRFSRLKSHDGRLLASQEQIGAIQDHGKETFASQMDEQPPSHLPADFEVDVATVSHELSRLGAGKAVPKHVAPASAWRICAALLSPIIGHGIRTHFKQGAPGKLEADWRDTHVVWLAKPNKPPVAVSNMRLIGLQCSTSKLLAGLLRSQLIQHLYPLLQHLPQFAFTKARGTADALLRAHSHFVEVSTILQQARVNRFQLQAGKSQQPCTGGICLSLDLSRAFDGANRPCIYEALRTHGVPPTIIHIVQALHFEARYHYRVGDATGFTTTSNGIKQGCVIALLLWSYYTVTFMLLLRERRSPQWLERILTLFADDCWGDWTISNEQEFLAAIADLQLIFETLESLHMTINYHKTAILLRLVGRDASRIRRAATFMAILKLPAHLTHVNTATVWERAGLDQPGTVLQRTLQHFKDRLQSQAAATPNITTTAVVFARLTALQSGLDEAQQQEAQHISQEPATPALVSCPSCDATFVSENAMRIHAKLAHKILPAAAAVATPPTAQTDLFEGQKVEHLPLIMRDTFIRKLDHWEQWLTVAPLMKELQNHCSICHQWIADFRHVRQHIHKVHKEAYGHLFEQELGPLESDIFAHCYNVGPVPSMMSHRATKRQRPEQHPFQNRFSSFPPRGGGPPQQMQQMYQVPQERDPIRLMSRIILQQEETICHLRNEKCFIMFLRHDQEGILQQLMAVSKEWNEKKEKTPDQLTSPLRTLLLQSMLQELLNRAQKEVATPEGRAKQLTQDNRPPIQHADLVRLLTWMLKELRGDIIQTFKSMPSLQKINTQTVQSSTFKLEISLRGQTSLEMHEAFAKLAACSVTHLVGISLKRDSLPQSHLARQLADITFRRR
ncbi:Pol [Symbiodinium sp. CCMP2592]|nr:Pol [Symbiodinium sp. CCMP2592]